MRVPPVVQPDEQRRLAVGAPVLPPRVVSATGVGEGGGGGAGRVQEAVHGVRETGAESTRRLGAGEEASVDSARGAALALLVLH